MSKNDITGDKLVSKTTTAAYRDNWDAIWAKPICEREDVKQLQKETADKMRKVIEDEFSKL